MTKAGEPTTTKVQTVTGTTASEGRTVHRFLTTTASNQGVVRNSTESLQYVEGSRLLRAFETTFKGSVASERLRFVPPALRLDTAPLPIGTVYEAQHVEQHLGSDGTAILVGATKVQTFTVEAVDERITVPAGTFQTVRIRRDTQGGSSKTYWYAVGVGKVREVGGQTEELSSWSLVDEL